MLAAAITMAPLSTSLLAQTDSSWRYYNRAARVAHDQKDYSAYRANVVKLNELLSGHARTLYSLASAEALLGNDDEAIRLLRRFAATGLVADVAADSDFVRLRTTPAFGDVVRQLEKNKTPIASATRAHVLPDTLLLPEDIVYDGASRSFFVSSMRRRTIVRVDASGRVSDFIESGKNGIWSILGLALDSRRHLLWATTVANPMMAPVDSADAGKAAVLAFDLRTGHLMKRYAVPGKEEHETGELAVDARGNVYVSDGHRGILYRLAPGDTVLEPLVDDSELVSPQGIAVRDDGQLFVADYVRGIAIIDPASRRVRWLAHPGEAPINGIDGLYLDHGALIAIQNGTNPSRVVRLALDAALARVTTATTLEANTPLSNETNHGAVVGREFFFISGSDWDRIAPDGTVKPGAKLEPPIIARLALP
jgi:streptogramin lyase